MSADRTSSLLPIEVIDRAICSESEDVVRLAAQWRRQLHAIPEIAFAESLTAEFVARKLLEIGIEVHRDIGGTGIVGVLRRGDSKRTIGLRAEMDALPMQEQNCFVHRSLHDGVMHACGHDGHTAMLLGAAMQLIRSGNFDGTVHLIFQPAEETGRGALAMLRDGLFERFPCDAIYAMHNRPSLPVGHFAVRKGAMMAAGGFLDIRVRGRSAHAARPDSGADAIYAGAAIIAELKNLVSRTVSSLEPAVVTATKFHGGKAYNVMPEEVAIGGTLRCCSKSTMDRLESALKNCACLVARALGTTAEADVRWIFPPTVNDDLQAEFVHSICSNVVGSQAVHRLETVNMASDDFGYFLERVGGCYFNIGTGSESHSCEVHHPMYDFNDEALRYGVRALVGLVETRLAIPRGGG